MSYHHDMFFSNTQDTKV